jgi:SAM-dependent methyltransferase
MFMSLPKENEQRVYWRQLWASTCSRESHDVWYALDEAKFDHLQRFLPPSGRSLEVGCGSARLSRFLAAPGFEVVGLDYELTALSLARQLGRKAPLSWSWAMLDLLSRTRASTLCSTACSSTSPTHHRSSAMTRSCVRAVSSSDIVPRKFSPQDVRFPPAPSRPVGEAFDKTQSEPCWRMPD